jgi:hypothetical protein
MKSLLWKLQVNNMAAGNCIVPPISRERQAFRSGDLDRFPADITDLVAEARFDLAAKLLQTRRMLGDPSIVDFVCP